MKFIKKPVAIEAIQYTGNNGNQLRQWSKAEVFESPVLEPTDDNPTGAYAQIRTLEGIMTARVGDWIIKGVKGEFYPCRADIFEATYFPESENIRNHCGEFNDQTGGCGTFDGGGHAQAKD